jgi:hypothetical protein
VMLSRSVVNPVRKVCVLLCAYLVNGHARNVFRVGTAARVSNSLTVSQAVRETGAWMFDSLRLCASRVCPVRCAYAAYC